MVSSINNNLSALTAFSKGLEVKANNIANISSENFKKNRAVIVEGENGAVKVEISKVETDRGIALLNPEENHTEIQPSNTDLTEEIPGMMIDQKGFQANLKVIETKEEMLGSVLDIIA